MPRPLASPLDRRDAARDESCARAGPLASPHDHHCSEPVPAARRAATAAEDRAPRIWHNRIGLPVVALLSARPRVASMPLRPRDPHNEPVPCSSHFMLLTLARRRQRPRREQRGRDGRAAVIVGAGPQAACAASRFSPFEPAFLSIPPQRRSEQRELMAPNACSNQSRRLAEIGRDSAV